MDLCPIRSRPIKTILILGSGPNATEAAKWPKTAFSHWMVINNAWRVRPDWDELIYPEDFAEDRLPAQLASAQTLTRADTFVPAQNAFGGFVFAGGTMAYTAAYTALYCHRPDVLAFLGCDMVYRPSGPTHFYGTGTPDPLRDDMTLQSLEAKSARLMILAAEQGCACVNLSSDESRLVFPRATLEGASRISPIRFDPTLVAKAKAYEERLGYFVVSGRYWEEADTFDASALRAVDTLWLEAAESGH